MSNSEPIKKRGRRPVDTELVRSRVGRSVLDAADRLIADRPEVATTRADVVRVAMTDWLNSLGYLPDPDTPN